MRDWARKCFLCLLLLLFSLSMVSSPTLPVVDEEDASFLFLRESVREWCCCCNVSSWWWQQEAFYTEMFMYKIVTCVQIGLDGLNNRLWSYYSLEGTSSKTSPPATSQHLSTHKEMDCATPKPNSSLPTHDILEKWQKQPIASDKIYRKARRNAWLYFRQTVEAKILVCSPLDLFSSQRK